MAKKNNLSVILISEHNTEKNCSFSRFASIFWFKHSPGYIIKHKKKSIWKRIESKKLQTNGNGNVLQNIKTILSIFLEKLQQNFLITAKPKLSTYIDQFMNEKGYKRL